MSPHTISQAPHTVTMAGAAGLGVAHLIVDAVCVTSVLRASPPSDALFSSAFAFVLGYDLVEAAYFALLFRRRRALLWSALANAASFGTGMLSRRLFGVP